MRINNIKDLRRIKMGLLHNYKYHSIALEFEEAKLAVSPLLDDKEMTELHTLEKAKNKDLLDAVEHNIDRLLTEEKANS